MGLRGQVQDLDSSYKKGKTEGQVFPCHIKHYSAVSRIVKDSQCRVAWKDLTLFFRVTYTRLYLVLDAGLVFISLLCYVRIINYAQGAGLPISSMSARYEYCRGTILMLI